jgi:hypothetical protein
LLVHEGLNPLFPFQVLLGSVQRFRLLRHVSGTAALVLRGIPAGLFAFPVIALSGFSSSVSIRWAAARCSLALGSGRLSSVFDHFHRCICRFQRTSGAANNNAMIRKKPIGFFHGESLCCEMKVEPSTVNGNHLNAQL